MYHDRAQRRNDHQVRPTILIIDDDRMMRGLMQRVFQGSYWVLCATNVDDGLNVVKRHRPDLVITDLNMPGKDGIKGTREIRRIDPDVPIIMFTGSATCDTEQEALEAGVTECLFKTPDIRGLRRTVQMQIERVRQHREESLTSHPTRGRRSVYAW